MIHKKTETIAFYNVENLFDTVNNPNTFDDDYTPKGKLKWDKKRYKYKTKRIASVISKLGSEENTNPPAIVGLVEVENAKVVSKLLKSYYLSNYHYGFVHFDSPDERGIDVALLYNKTAFELLSTEHFPLYLENKHGERDYTRDILVVSGNLNGELIHVLVNHWPSRAEGTEISEPKRIKAAQLAREIIENIQARIFDAKIIIMGDFNDGPESISVENHLVKEDFFNPMKQLFDKEKYGSTSHKKMWSLFDQIIFSKNFFEPTSEKHQFIEAKIFIKEWMKVKRGKLKGSPFRTYIGPWYQGGFSDHFPVYAILEKKD